MDWDSGGERRRERKKPANGRTLKMNGQLRLRRRQPDMAFCLLFGIGLATTKPYALFPRVKLTAPLSFFYLFFFYFQLPYCPYHFTLYLSHLIYFKILKLYLFCHVAQTRCHIILSEDLQLQFIYNYNFL